ncbi:MAG: TonB-dependent receptor, partial [Pseudomonadota bacterium]
SGLVTSAITNLDIRAEWFFSSGDNFTVSLFYKDISDPIETIKEAGTDDNVSLTFVNGENAEYYGVEVEWFKDLSAFEGLVGSWINPFYFSGNFFLSDAEITIGEVALDLTNNTRRPTQHSQWGANIQFGFDAPNNKHSANMVYNVFGERLFFAERFGAPDGFEQPFHSLDVVYTWFPTDRVEAKFRVQNILDDNIEITQGGVSTIEQTLGRTGRIDISWNF